MNEISTKVKSLNFFQRLRMEHVKNLLRKNRMTIDKFLRLPEYIQYNHAVLARAIHSFENEELRRINPSAICAVNQDYDFLRGYSDETIIQLVQDGVISINNKNETLVYDLISSGYFEILDSLNERSREFITTNCYKRLVAEGKTEQAKGIVPHLNENYLLELCKENSSIFTMLPIDKQIVIADKETSFIKYLPIEEQHKIVKQKSFWFFNDLSLDAKVAYIKNNPSDTLRIDKLLKIHDSLIELVAEDISLYEILPNEWKREIQHNLDNPINARIFAKLLLNDIKCSKDFNIETSYSNGINNTITELSKLIENVSDEDLINLCLHSKFLSAIGKLSSGNIILHRQGSETIYGIDSYTDEQIEFLQGMNLSIITELVKTDSNYILPYVAGKDKGIHRQTHEERVNAEERAKALFIELYGVDQYSEYSQCISTVFDLEEEYSKAGEVNPVEVPLEELKILFNYTIMEKCNPDLIKKYFNALKNREEIHMLFEEIIQEAYGDRALEILKARPQLNVHSINSLEVFDSRILDEYGEGFVHDCISYNIRNFSEFLDVIKDEGKSELFREYYNILTEIFGNNVETMQKAISEFSYVEGILRQVNDIDLTNEQAMNLLNVLSSEKNPLNIETLDDLNNYDNLADDQLQSIIQELENITGSDYGIIVDEIKDALCRNILGIGLKDSRDVGYGNSVEYVYKLYDISEGASSTEEYNSEEKRLLNIMNFIINENNPRNILAFIKNLGHVTSIRNYTAVAKVIEKVQEKELKEMNRHITTLEKLDEICENQQDSETPTVYREEIDGVRVYHLNGEPFCMFQHDPGNATLEDLLYYEGQAGNMAICTRLVNSKSSGISRIHPGMYLYGEIPSKGVITIGNRDAGTTHTAKRTRMYGWTNIRVTELEQIDNYGNEVAMYRRQRDHSRINNENTGGNIPPMAYSVVIYKDGRLSAGLGRKAKELKGTGIAIIVYHEGAYREKQQLQERRNSTKTQEVVLSR